MGDSKPVIAGEALAFDMVAKRIVCCDCGLTHIILLEWANEEPYLTFYYDEQHTKEKRRAKRKAKKRKK